MLGHFVVHNLLKQARVQHTIRPPINCRLHASHQLRNLPAREPLSPPGSLTYDIICQVLYGYLLGLLLKKKSQAQFAWPVCMARFALEVELEKLEALVFLGEWELDDLIDAVSDGTVEVSGTVSGEDEDNVSRLVTRAEEQCIQRASLGFAHITYSHRKASASSINSSRPLFDFLAQSNISCILVTAWGPKGATSPPEARRKACSGKVPDGFWCLMWLEQGVLFASAVKDARQCHPVLTYSVWMQKPQLQCYNLAAYLQLENQPQTMGISP
ncbi:protein tyrosine phosphatase [Striga asiatica]|uniref:Protein tyrosine phosphatase n=1 Tax=Striga asiatica TaxID=4170 RepID=A0A5A7QZT3_STRAF|nr:protein tyrosine phosphatase [Striga asiatica]